jgi:general bacterial porin, GBP family
MIKPCVLLLALAGYASANAAQSTFQPPADIPEGPNGKTTLSIYGLLDLYIGQVHSGSQAPLAGASQWRLSDGTTYGPGSRFDFKVNQDLGSGWSAGLLMELGYLANQGTLAQGGRIFGRQGFAFIKSDDLGEFRFGRQYMLDDDSVNSTNPTGGTTGLAPGSVANVKAGTIALWIDPSRIDNALQYASPIYGGLQGKAMLAFNQGVQDRYEGLKLAYNSGPIGVEAVYEQSSARVPVNGKTTVNKVTQLGANYDFGAVKLFAGAQQGKDLTTGIGTQVGTWALPTLPGPATQLKSFNVGASTQIGRTFLFGNFQRTQYQSASGATVNISRFGPGAMWWWNKQTAFYGAVAIIGSDLKDYVNEKTLVQVGFRKFF